MVNDNEVMEYFGFEDWVSMKKWAETLEPDYILKDTSCLYTDGDSGIMLIFGWSEVFDGDGIQMRTVDCNYCDLDAGELMTIVLELQRRWQRKWAYQDGFDDGYDSCQEGRSLLDKEE